MKDVFETIFILALTAIFGWLWSQLTNSLVDSILNQSLDDFMRVVTVWVLTTLQVIIFSRWCYDWFCHWRQRVTNR